MLIRNRNVDILCISETWLLPHTPDRYIHIPDYNVFRCDKGHGGGACIYVRSNLNCKLLTKEINKPNGIEEVWLNVQCRKLPSIIVGCIYRHPKGSVETFNYLNEVLKLMNLRNKPLYVLGDLNDDQLSTGNKLSKIINTNKLNQIIDKPTRITPTSATTLDLIIVNKPESIIHSDVVPKIVGDHELISVKINMKKPKRVPVCKTFRQMSNYDATTFCNLLLDKDYALNQIMATDDVDEQVDIFTSIFNSCLDVCAPIVSKQVNKPFAPWINDEIRSQMKERHDLLNILKKDRSNVVLQMQYKAKNKQLKTSRYKTKTEYYRQQFNNNRGNISGTWKIINDIVPNKKNCINNNHFQNVPEKAEEFNNYFASVGKQAYENSRCNVDANNTNPPATQNIHPNNLFRPQPVDTKDIILTIKQLKNTSSAGIDGITPKFLKDSLNAIIPYLTCMINTSIVTGKVPTLWKQAIVVPIFKNGDRENISNYRPISLLPIISKILERVVANQLMLFLETNNILAQSQHGFRPKLSTATALSVLTDEIYKNIDNKKISLLTLCDLSKAFDSINHKLLLKKLTDNKIDIFWFENYLNDRTQSVRINDHISSSSKISYGVPQGSILGPLLFTIFVNDMSENIIDCLLIQYADDTQLLHSGTVDELHNLIRRAEATICTAKQYFCKNGLMLNSDKTQCIFIGSRQLIKRIPNDTEISIDNSHIIPCNHVKNLGVYIDSTMTFEKHINEITKKVNGILFYLNRIKDNFDMQTRKIVVQSLALSVLYYCLEIYGKTNDTLLHNIQKLQNFASKVTVGAKKYDHVTPIINKLEWMTISQQLTFEVAVTTFKAQNNLYPNWFSQFPTINDISNSTTRQQNDLYVPRTRTDYGARSLKVSGPKIWNDLPNLVRDSNNLPVFKGRLKKHILEAVV